MQVSHLFGHGGEAVLIVTAHETGERVNIAGGAAGLLGATAMPEVSVSFALWCPTASTMHPTNAITFHGRRTTTRPCAFRLGLAARGALAGGARSFRFGTCPTLWDRKRDERLPSLNVSHVRVLDPTTEVERDTVRNWRAVRFCEAQRHRVPFVGRWQAAAPHIFFRLQQQLSIRGELV